MRHLVLHRVTEGPPTYWTDIDIDKLEKLIKLSKYNTDIVLTFDDGSKSDITLVLPRLVKYETIAIFFIVTDYIGKEGYLNWEDIAELHNSGMIIGSHSKSHADLTKLSEQEVYNELFFSKSILEANLNISVDHFSFPFGATDKITRNLALNLYKYVYTSNAIELSTKVFGRMSINNKTVVASDPNNAISLSIIKIKCVFLIVSVIKIFLGVDKYKFLRSVVHKWRS